MKMNPLDKLSWLLVTLGGLNWGMVGFFKYNVVEHLFGFGPSTTSKVVYDIVGVAALWSVIGMIMMLTKMDKS